MAEERKINLNIVDGDAFYSHEMSINFNPTQFILDFKCITPRVDQRNPQAPSINLKHNVVMIDPFHATRIHELLGKVIKKYEDEFGKIEQSKAAKAMEKKHKKAASSKSATGTETPSYFG